MNYRYVQDITLDILVLKFKTTSGKAECEKKENVCMHIKEEFVQKVILTEKYMYSRPLTLQGGGRGSDIDIEVEITRKQLAKKKNTSQNMYRF